MAQASLITGLAASRSIRSRLAAGDSRYFARMLAPRDQWRAFPEFKDRVLYLDIETPGAAGVMR